MTPPPNALIAALTATLLLSACAEVPTDLAERAEYDRNNDPAEPTNRAVFAANQFLDRNLLQPVARGYKDYVPGRARHSIHNFVGNLGEPAVAVNDVLQGNISRAWNTSQRFVVNSVVGGGGLFDVATDWDLPGHPADFGQTLGVWDFGPGPAVQLPLFGPSNVRDSIGKVAELVVNPLNFVPGSTMTNIDIGGTISGVVDGRATLLSTTDSLERNSLDYYAALRSAMAQHREQLVAEGKVGLIE